MRISLMCIVRRFKYHVFHLLLMCYIGEQISLRYIAQRVEVLCIEEQISLRYVA